MVDSEVNRFQKHATQQHYNLVFCSVPGHDEKGSLGVQGIENQAFDKSVVEPLVYGSEKQKEDPCIRL